MLIPLTDDDIEQFQTHLLMPNDTPTQLFRKEQMDPHTKAMV